MHLCLPNLVLIAQAFLLLHCRHTNRQRARHTWLLSPRRSGHKQTTAQYSLRKSQHLNNRTFRHRFYRILSRLKLQKYCQYSIVTIMQNLLKTTKNKIFKPNVQWNAVAACWLAEWTLMDHSRAATTYLIIQQFKSTSVTVPHPLRCITVHYGAARSLASL